MSFIAQKILPQRFQVFAGRVTDEKMWNPLLWNLYGAQSQSGETVNEQTALTYSAVWNALLLYGGTLGSLPLHLMRRNGRKNEHATDHSTYKIMHTAANPYMTAMALRECLTIHVLSWGNGYAEKVYDKFGNLAQLWPIPPNRVKPRMAEGDLVYEIKVDGDTVVLPRSNVLHVPGVGFDGFVGYSVVGMAQKSIGLGMAMETFGSHYFGQGTHPGVVVSHPKSLGETASQNLKKSLVDAYSGLGKSHRLLLLEEGMKLEKIGIPPNDSQFLESRQFQITDIARWFNLPVHKLKEMTKSSFNNIESEQASFVTDSLLPWSIRLEQNYNMQLLPERDLKAGLYFKHVFEGLLRGNTKDRGEFYGQMLDRGVFSINEVRELEDKNPVEGGDIHLVPLNMTTLENAGQQIEDKTAQEPPEGQDNGDIEDIVNLRRAKDAASHTERG